MSTDVKGTVEAEESTPSDDQAKSPIPPARAAWGKYALGMAALAIPVALFADDPYWLNLVTTAFIFAGLALAWNIIGGFGGQFSLGHGVFFAVGAYTVTILYTRYEISPWLGLFPAIVLGVIVAAGMSWPTFRLKGPFFAIATMALNEVAFALANYFEEVTGGARGVQVAFRPSFANMIFPDRWMYGVLAFVFMALVAAISVYIKRSYLGYALFAVREDEESARAMGINVLSIKMTGMLISAALTTVGGAIFGMYIRFIDPPTLFSLPEVGVRFALLSLIGGLGTVIGPIVGALIVQPGATYLRGSMQAFGPGAHLIVLGGLMVLAALFFRGGIVGFLNDLRTRWQSRSEE